MKKIQENLGYKKEETLFVGDDINDLVVKDSVNLLVTQMMLLISSKKSSLNSFLKNGEGAIRELAERVLDSKGIFGEDYE